MAGLRPGAFPGAFAGAIPAAFSGASLLYFRVRFLVRRHPNYLSFHSVGA